MALVFLLGQLAIFSELGREVGVGFLLVGIARVGVSSGVGSTRVAGVVFIIIVVFIVVVVFIFVRVWSSGVAGDALALVVGMLRFHSSWSFSGHFGAVFSIIRINRLGEGAKVREGVGFTNAGNFVLDLGQEPMV